VFSWENDQQMGAKTVKKSSKGKNNSQLNVKSYSTVALPHLQAILEMNTSVIGRLVEQIVEDVQKKRSLFVFGSGHSAILPLELYHRAGGASFVIPLIADYLLPSAGPPVVRVFERTPGSANFLLNRAQPEAGEMIWIASQSGINGAVVDLALEARKRKMRTVAFTSVTHSSAVESRHPSKKRLYEVCDEVVDWGGHVGDAAIQATADVSTGPLSSLSGIFLAHSILSTAVIQLERKGIRCVYTSVNTPAGEARNRKLEEAAQVRDPLLR
jgi:uncharacterized phosphosugar-binding protein